MVLDWASAFAKPVIDRDEKVLHKMKAYFTGYRKYGMSHERTVAIYDDEFWEVQDRLLNWRRRSHKYRLHWLLIDGEWKVESGENTVALQIKTDQGIMKLVVRHPANMSCKTSVVRAGGLVYGERDVKPYEGWVSRNYGEKFPALSFAFEIESAYHTTFTSEFSFSD